MTGVSGPNRLGTVVNGRKDVSAETRCLQESKAAVRALAASTSGRPGSTRRAPLLEVIFHEKLEANGRSAASAASRQRRRPASTLRSVTERCRDNPGRTPGRELDRASSRAEARPA